MIFIVTKWLQNPQDSYPIDNLVFDFIIIIHHKKTKYVINALQTDFILVFGYDKHDVELVGEIKIKTNS